MDFTGRPNGYRDYLATVKDGPWYDWKKNSDGTYHFADINLFWMDISKNAKQRVDQWFLKNNR